MASRAVDPLLHAASRVKRSIHRATSPRTPPPVPELRSEREIAQLLALFFPAGQSDEEAVVARDMLRDHPLTPATVRQMFGMFDQQTSPTPFDVRLEANDVIYVDLAGIQVALDRADYSVSVPIIRSGQWEPHVERVLRDLLTPGAVFVDIGANVGWHSALAASIVGSQGLVYAIEPNPHNVRLIAHTIERNQLGQVRLLPFALSESMGIATFSTGVGSNGGFTSGDRAQAIDPTTTMVPTMRFDDLAIAHVDVIKIDVEGAEPIVLRGAAATIERDHPAIVFEFSAEMTQRIGGVAARDHLGQFESYGYELSIIEQPTGRLIPVPDVDALLADWGSPIRIEDFLAVRRHEHPMR